MTPLLLLFDSLLDVAFKPCRQNGMQLHHFGINTTVTMETMEGIEVSFDRQKPRLRSFKTSLVLELPAHTYKSSLDSLLLSPVVASMLWLLLSIIIKQMPTFFRSCALLINMSIPESASASLFHVLANSVSWVWQHRTYTHVTKSRKQSFRAPSVSKMHQSHLSEKRSIIPIIRLNNLSQNLE